MLRTTGSDRQRPCTALASRSHDRVSWLGIHAVRTSRHLGPNDYMLSRIPRLRHIFGRNTVARFVAVRPGVKRLGITFFALLGFVLSLFSGLAGVAAQDIDYDMTSYGYFSDDGDTGLMLIHIEPDDPRLAAEFVSPVYAEEFLQTIGILDEYWWAEGLERGVPESGRGRRRVHGVRGRPELL